MNYVLCQTSMYAAMILAALALVAALQTISLQGKKRIVGAVVVILIAAAAIFSFVHQPQISKGPFANRKMDTTEKLEFKNAPMQQESGIKRYNRTLIPFSKEMDEISNSIAEISEVNSSSEMDNEKIANKALGIKDRASKFYNRVQHSYVPPEATDIHSTFVSAAEHLRLAAFALHAEKSSEDKAFRDLQSEQLKEQLKLATDLWAEAFETLSKLAPEFFNNQQKVNK